MRKAVCAALALALVLAATALPVAAAPGDVIIPPFGSDSPSFVMIQIPDTSNGYQNFFALRPSLAGIAKKQEIFGSGSFNGFWGYGALDGSMWPAFPGGGSVNTVWWEMPFSAYTGAM